MTSSSRSCSLDESEHWLATLPAVLADVAEQLFFAWAEPCDAERFGELSADDHSWIQAQVGFNGVVSGAVAILLPSDVAREMGLTVTGSPDLVLNDDELDDVAGEFANMVCGALLTRADRNQQFELRPPQVTRAAACYSSDDRRYTRLFCLNDRPLLVRLDLGAD